MKETTHAHAQSTYSTLSQPSALQSTALKGVPEGEDKERQSILLKIKATERFLEHFAA